MFFIVFFYKRVWNTAKWPIKPVMSLNNNYIYGIAVVLLLVGINKMTPSLASYFFLYSDIPMRNIILFKVVDCFSITIWLFTTVLQTITYSATAFFGVNDVQYV